MGHNVSVEFQTFKNKNRIKLVQGGHIPAEIKFPVLSLGFPCVMNFFPVLFSTKLIDGFE